MPKVNFILAELEKNKVSLPTYVKVYKLDDDKVIDFNLVIDTFYVPYLVAVKYASKWESHVWRDNGMVQLSSVIELNQSQIAELKLEQIAE